MAKVAVCKLEDLPDGKMIKVEAGGREVLLARTGSDIHAVDDTCTHAGASLADGKLEGTVITCGWHGAQFECTDGTLAKFPAKIDGLRKYAVTVEDGSVFVEV